jgi:hypothetical protein
MGVMAKSPFPGMDPFLEQDWTDVHSALVAYCCDQLQDQLPQNLCARLSVRFVLEDDLCFENPFCCSNARVVESRCTTDTAVVGYTQDSIQPDTYLVENRAEPASQRFIEIVDSQTRSRVITTIELISPSNKVPGQARDLFLTKRKDCLNAGVNVVEIDLTRGGDRSSILPLAKVVSQPTYVGCVWRAIRKDAIAVYLMPLAQPLKPMRIPLRATDEDVVLQMQPLVAQAYDRGRYGNLDYSRPLYPPLSDEESAFLHQTLQRPEANT